MIKSHFKKTLRRKYLAMFINVKERKKKGKSASRSLRKKDIIPAIIYGGDSNPMSIEIQHNKLWNSQHQNRSIRGMKITLFIEEENKKQKVKIQDVQKHPYKSKISHVDFLRIVDCPEKIKP